MNKAKVYLIPNLLGEAASIEQSLPPYNLQVIDSLQYFAVEHLKDMRRLLVKCGLKHKINQSEFFEINKHSQKQEADQILQVLKSGNSVGVVSDAGCPGIADPGTEIIRLAHQNSIEVVPLIGPSSILLALISSGFNGQAFTFHGYLPRESNKRIKVLKKIEAISAGDGSTQLFMETPYRNQAVFSDVLNCLNPRTMLCIAMDLSLSGSKIRSHPISYWKKKQAPKLQKRPAIFLISA